MFICGEADVVAPRQREMTALNRYNAHCCRVFASRIETAHSHCADHAYMYVCVQAVACEFGIFKNVL